MSFDPNIQKKKHPSFYTQITPSLCQVRWDQCDEALKMKSSLSLFALWLPGVLCFYLTCLTHGAVKHFKDSLPSSPVKEKKKS